MSRYGLLVAGFHYPDIPADEFDDWYDTEHIPERMGVTGFLNAQRWVATDGSATAMATYDLTSLRVLKDPAYTVRKGDGRTPWSKRIARKTALFLRLTAEQILPGNAAGPEDAGGLLMFATNVAPEAEADFNAWYDQEHIPLLSEVPGVLSARRFRTDEGTHAYVALYHLSHPEVSTSAEWDRALQTPWTRKITPSLQDSLHLVFARYEANRG